VYLPDHDTMGAYFIPKVSLRDWMEEVLNNSKAHLRVSINVPGVMLSSMASGSMPSIEGSLSVYVIFSIEGLRPGIV
jgi:hypothetical protein